MLEPTRPQTLEPTRWRSVAMRHGIDLEPELPDPSPAFVDPEDSLHPALTEPLSAIPLFSFPTPEARSALVGRMLSEPGRARSADSSDPFVAIERFAELQGMEPEILGSLHLLIIRGLFTGLREAWRAPARDPEIALRDPDVDPWLRRRPRLREAGRPVVERIGKVLDLASRLGDGAPAPPFERVGLSAAADWLAACAAWWRVVDMLGPEEQIPAHPEGREALAQAMAQARLAVSQSMSLPLLGTPGSATLLGTVCAAGLRSELDFLAAVGERPDGPIHAQWLLQAQLRALRDLFTLTQGRSLGLHTLLRQVDRARVAAQIAWRLVMLDLWLADARGEDSADLERALLHLPDPIQPTTLFAGLGRVRGFVLLRRLRRGDTKHAETIAEGALHLAPAELAVRIAWNDLRWFRGRQRRPTLLGTSARSGDSCWDLVLLASLRTEADRWSSVSVGAMGAAVARHLGDRSAVKRFRHGLVGRALEQQGAESWAVAVVETLLDPTDRRSASLLDRLIECAPAEAPPPGPLSAIVFHTLDPEELRRATEDLTTALLEAREALQGATTLESGPVRVDRPRQEAWRQVLLRGWPAADHPEWEEEVVARIQALRAAAPALRTPPIAAALRGLVHALERGQEVLDSRAGEASDRGIARSLLAGFPAIARAFLDESASHEALVQNAEEATAVLLRGVRRPRTEALGTALRRVGARMRARLDDLGREEVARLLAALAEAEHSDSIDTRLDRIEDQLARLELAVPAVHDGTEPGAPDLMAFHEEFDPFSELELGLRPDHLPRVRELVALFNLCGGRRDRKRLKGAADFLFELRSHGTRWGAIRVFYRQEGKGWLALAAMRKHDDRDQRDAIARVARHFGPGAA